MPSSILQKFRNVGRLTHIVNILARYGFKREIQRTELGDLLHQQNETIPHEQQNHTHHSRAQRLAMAFEELGPTFVKLAQLLSAREDLLPKSYIEEFKRLRDKVKPITRELVEKTLQNEFTKDLMLEIETIDYNPIGSASIGQVHRAQLKDGSRIVFKIQRPDIDVVINNDLAILMAFASILETALPELKLLRPTVIVTELRRSLLNELDYSREAANTERMRQFFKDHESITIPKIYYKFCTSKILCMSEIQGIKLTESNTKLKNNNSLVRTGVEAFLDMTFQFGIFHGDLHPGNFILMNDGKLAILDFGLTVRLKRDLRNTMAFMFYSLSKHDIETCARLFIELTEKDDLYLSEQLESEIIEILDNIISLPAQDLHLGKVLMRIARISASRSAPMGRDLILFFRALIALETFGRSIDPKFQILEFATEYYEKNSLFQFDKKWLERNIGLAMHDSGALIKDLPITLRILAKKLQSGALAFQFKSEDIIFLTRELDRASNRLSLAILLGSIVLGSSIATYGKQGRLYDFLATFGLIGFGSAVILGLWLIIGIIRSGRFK